MREDREVATGRLVTLDALRGFAVMGILAMNIVAFAMPEMAYVSPKAYGGETPSDIAAWMLGFILFDGKMRGLFSILFGASMLLIIDRAEASGQDAAPVHYRRMAWLAVFGLCHYFLIWWGDILFLYASVGCIAFCFRRWEARRLIAWAIGLFTLGVVLTSLFFGAQLAVASAADDPASPLAEAGQGVRKEYAKIDRQVADELALYRGPYLSILEERLGSAANPFIGILMTIFETLPLMMIGMALFRNGFLTGTWPAADYRRIASRWLPPGLLLTLLVVWLQSAIGLRLSRRGQRLHGVGAAGATDDDDRLCRASRAADPARPFQRVARPRRGGGPGGLSNYLGTSIVMTTLFYGYGLGLFGDVGRWTLYLVCALMWAGMLLWSTPWLQRFHYGPFEWLWRSLARGSLQPMRRQ